MKPDRRGWENDENVDLTQPIVGGLSGGIGGGTAGAIGGSLLRQTIVAGIAGGGAAGLSGTAASDIKRGEVSSAIAYLENTLAGATIGGALSVLSYPIGRAVGHIRDPDPFDVSQSAAAGLRSFAREATLVGGDPAAAGVIMNSRNGVSFAHSRYLYPAAEGQSSVVEIQYTGSRTTDFAAANAVSGIANGGRPPRGWVWHHVDDYNPATNTGTMELVDQAAHEVYKPHAGGVRQYEIAKGVKYKR